MAEGALIVTEGGVLSTAKVSLGPAASAKRPTESTAVPAATEIPKVPSPVIPEIVTVRVLPLPDTLTIPLAVPVLFKVTSFVLSEIVRTLTVP